MWLLMCIKKRPWDIHNFMTDLHVWSSSQAWIQIAFENGHTFRSSCGRGRRNEDSTLFRFWRNCWYGKLNGSIRWTHEDTGMYIQCTCSNCLNKWILKVFYHYLINTNGQHSQSLQISVATKDLLEKEGSFNYIKRETTNPKLREDVVTYWLIGRKTGQTEAKSTHAGTEAETEK